MSGSPFFFSPHPLPCCLVVAGLYLPSLCFCLGSQFCFPTCPWWEWLSGCGSAILLLFYHHHRKKYLVGTQAPHRNALLLSAQPADHSFLTSHSALKRLMLTAAILWLLFPCIRQQEWTDAWSNCEVRAVHLSAKRTRGTDIETDL